MGKLGHHGKGAELNADAFPNGAIQRWKWNTATMPEATCHRHQSPPLPLPTPPFASCHKLVENHCAPAFIHPSA